MICKNCGRNVEGQRCVLCGVSTRHIVFTKTAEPQITLSALLPSRQKKKNKASPIISIIADVLFVLGAALILCLSPYDWQQWLRYFEKDGEFKYLFLAICIFFFFATTIILATVSITLCAKRLKKNGKSFGKKDAALTISVFLVFSSEVLSWILPICLPY